MSTVTPNTKRKGQRWVARAQTEGKGCIYEHVQRPFTTTVELRNDLVILSCFCMKTVSAFVRSERPWTAATPVPAIANQGTFFMVRQESVRTNVSKEDQERQQNHEQVAVPNDEASVKLTWQRSAPTDDTRKQ